MTEQDKIKAEMPESLLRQLSEFEKRLRIMETVVTVTGGLFGIMLTYGILFISDRLWDTPAWLRVILTITGCATFAFFASLWLRNWWWRRRDITQLARIVQKKYSNMGDRLLGAVELARGTSMPENMSPALCRAAIRQVAEESQKYDFKTAAGGKKPRKYSASFLILAAIIVASTAFSPNAGINALQRWLKPISNIERYTFVRIEAMPDEQVVPHGEAFEIGCNIDRQSAWQPVRAVCSFANQAPVESRISGNKAIFNIPGQVTAGTLTIRIGDVVKSIRIIPLFRPELSEIKAEIVLPEYLQRTNQPIVIESARVELLDTGKVKFAGTLNRALKHAAVMQKTETLLTTISNKFFTSEFSVKALETCSFTWTDCFGLSGAQPYILNITKVQDEPPAVECIGTARAMAILEDEIVDLDTSAEDDYGIKELWVAWSTAGSKERGIKETSGLQTIKAGSPLARTLAGKFSFSPIALHIPEETMVTLFASAVDYYPGRKPSISLTYRIYVLSKTRHAKLIQEQFQALQAKLEDLAREEERLLDSNTELGKQSSEKLLSEKTSESLKTNTQSEKNNAEQLNSLAASGEELLKQALRNTDIPEETLRKWAELMKAMKDLAKSQMQDSAKSLQTAAAEKGKRSEELNRAIDLEQEILKALRKIEKGMSVSLDDMMAKNFINRLLMIAGTERDAAETLRKLLPEIVGISPENLPDDKKETINMLATRHDAARKETSGIQDDLAGFFNRTRTERYDTVHKQMVEKKTTENMDLLTGMVRRNSTAQAIGSAETWRKQFTDWAEMLKDKSGDSEKDSSGKCALENADIELLIALMRARRREEGLRDQTRLIEEEKAKNKNYTADAIKLAEMQDGISKDIRPLERKARNPKLARFIEKIGGEMMNVSVYLRKPQTDSSTIAIETEIIELLSGCLSMCSGEGGSAGALAQMLMQAAGMQKGSGAGQTGGGSNAGGTTDKGNTVTATGSGDERPENRDVEKAGGGDTTGMPEEFKEMLESYFNAVEGEK